MESRDIYNLTKRNIKWDNDWIHIGTGDQVKKSELIYYLREHFKNQDLLMLKRGRLNSELTEKENLLNKIIYLVGNENFEVWSNDFTKAMKFAKIGVINKGETPYNNT